VDRVGDRYWRVNISLSNSIALKINLGEPKKFQFFRVVCTSQLLKKSHYIIKYTNSSFLENK